MEKRLSRHELIDRILNLMDILGYKYDPENRVEKLSHFDLENKLTQLESELKKQKW